MPEGLAASAYGIALLMGGGLYLGAMGGDDLGLPAWARRPHGPIVSRIARRLVDASPSLGPAVLLAGGAIGLIAGEVMAAPPAVSLLLALLGGGITAAMAVVAAKDRTRARELSVALVSCGLLFTVFLFTVVVANRRTLAFDAYAYWSVDLDSLYSRSAGTLIGAGAFYYPPPIAQVLGSLDVLPFATFVLLYEAMLLAILAWLGGRAFVVLLALPFVALELYLANVHALLAAVVVFALRVPALWAFVLLTKVTPGIGLVWFVARREWRNLALALGATGAVVALSFVTAPGLWGEWLAMLEGNLSTSAPFTIPPPLPFRLALAALFVTWGARTERPWTVPVGAAIGLPVLWPHGLTVALGALPLLRAARHVPAGINAAGPERAAPRPGDLLARVALFGLAAAALAVLVPGPLDALVDGLTTNYP